MWLQDKVLVNAIQVGGALKGGESSRRLASCCPLPLSPTWKTGVMACTPAASLDYEATVGMGALATDTEG